MWVKTKQTFAENLAQMPEIHDVICIRIVEAGWRRLLKKIWKSASVPEPERAKITQETPDLLRLFYYLASSMGELNKSSAQRAYELLADQSHQAQQHPGQHAALATLLEVLSTNRTFDLKIETNKENTHHRIARKTSHMQNE